MVWERDGFLLNLLLHFPWANTASLVHSVLSTHTRALIYPPRTLDKAAPPVLADVAVARFGHGNGHVCLTHASGPYGTGLAVVVLWPPPAVTLGHAELRHLDGAVLCKAQDVFQFGLIVVNCGPSLPWHLPIEVMIRKFESGRVEEPIHGDFGTLVETEPQGKITIGG